MRLVRRAFAVGATIAALMALPCVALASLTLNSELLSVSAFPAGWSVGATGTAGDTEKDCVDGVERLLAPNPSAEVVFEDQGFLPAVAEELHKGNERTLYARSLHLLTT